MGVGSEVCLTCVFIRYHLLLEEYDQTCAILPLGEPIFLFHTRKPVAPDIAVGFLYDFYFNMILKLTTHLRVGMFPLE